MEPKDDAPSVARAVPKSFWDVCRFDGAVDVREIPDPEDTSPTGKARLDAYMAWRQQPTAAESKPGGLYR